MVNGNNFLRYFLSVFKAIQFENEKFSVSLKIFAYGQRQNLHKVKTNKELLKSMQMIVNIFFHSIKFQMTRHFI